MPENRPNIILIMADQWRADCLGLNGHPVVQTPNLDNIFRDGTSFTQAYAAVPSCIAARASLLTGLSPRTHGRTGYLDRVPWNYENTIPSLLSDAGYHAHCAGKMHVFPARNLMGFHSIDLHDGYLHNERCRTDDYRLVDDYVTDFRAKYGPNAEIYDAGVGCNGYSVTPWPYEENLHPTNWVTTKSIDFLRRRDPTKPFFLKVSYHRPHPPLDPPQHYLDRYRDIELPPLNIGDWVDHKVNSRGNDSPVPITKAQVDLARRAYYAHMTHIDCQLNRIIHALNEQNVYDNTMFIFVSDHGEMLYDHNYVAKALPYSGCAQVPLLIRFPRSSWDRGNQQSKCDLPVELRDVLPTIMDVAGIETPKEKEGASLVPLCNGNDLKWREYIHGEHEQKDRSNQWITDGREMYAWFSQTGVEHLFDLTTDPCNMHDLSKAKPERLKFWRDKLIRELGDREEEYVKNGKLIVGKQPKKVLGHIMNTCGQIP